MINESGSSENVMIISDLNPDIGHGKLVTHLAAAGAMLSKMQVMASRARIQLKRKRNRPKAAQPAKMEGQR